MLKRIENIAEIEISRIHDVGCGVGFLINDLRDMGKVVSGNDLNAYAVDVMRDSFNLDVHCCNISDLPIEYGSIDAIIAKDYIEHTWHPQHDLKCMFDLLKKNGVLHLETFHIDCKKIL